MIKEERFILLDGHIRLESITGTRSHASTVLIATDDEAYTYNRRVNRMTTIQEHIMIVKAIKRLPHFDLVSSASIFRMKKECLERTEASF